MDQIEGNFFLGRPTVFLVREILHGKINPYMHQTVYTKKRIYRVNFYKWYMKILGKQGQVNFFVFNGHLWFFATFACDIFFFI